MTNELTPRRLIKFGHSSFIISLPKEWLDKNKLKRGDLIYMNEAENELILSTHKKAEKEAKLITINVDNKNEDQIVRGIISAYINGFDELTIIGKSLNSNKDIVEKALQNKIGIEVIDQSKNSIIVKNILDFNAISFNKIFLRMDNVIRSMFEDLKSGLQKPSFGEWLVKEIYKADTEVNKIYLLILKLTKECNENPSLIRLLGTSNKELFSSQHIAFDLEYIGDELKKIAKLFASSRFKLEDKEHLLELLNFLESEHKELMSCYYNHDKEKAHKISGERKHFTMLSNKFFEKKTFPKRVEICEKLEIISGYIHDISKIIGY